MNTIDKIYNNKKQLLEALKEYKGIISSACDAVNLSRQTFYNYIDNDPEFAQSVQDINEASIDFVESKLFEKINGVSMVSYDSKGAPTVYEQPPSDTAIIFYLKTKGKKRGYVERQEVTGSDGKSIVWSETKTYDSN
jgi:hypothetical protein